MTRDESPPLGFLLHRSCIAPFSVQVASLAGKFAGMPIPSSIPGLGDLVENLPFIKDFADLMEKEVIGAEDDGDENGDGGEAVGVSDIVENIADCLDTCAENTEECADLLQQCFHGE